MGDTPLRRIGEIALHWSDWFEVLTDDRGGQGMAISNQIPGLYEVKYADNDGDERLSVGKAADLRMPVRQGLEKGKLPYAGGIHSRGTEDLSRLVVSWAMTDRPAAAEEEQRRGYRAEFSTLPAFVRST
jgi:hypothetical protein